MTLQEALVLFTLPHRYCGVMLTHKTEYQCMYRRYYVYVHGRTETVFTSLVVTFAFHMIVLQLASTVSRYTHPRYNRIFP